jgi:dimethylhistidine N-methyltransferase
MSSSGTPEILDLHPQAEDLTQEVLDGLSSEQATLPSKLLYDDEGSRLFEAICELPEYYPTRTEMSILEACRPELRQLLGDDIALLEYGSGSTRKVRLLLDGLSVKTYVPVDISRYYLEVAAKELQASHASLEVRPILADFSQTIDLPEDLADQQHVAFFPGGTIGNLAHDEAVAFLQRVGHTIGKGGRLLVGFDVRKNPNRIHAAYNDAAGTTADFNRNLLKRLNRDLGGDFDVSAWHHYAPFVLTDGRIEMHLVAASDQVVRVMDHRFSFSRGESIRTEMSHKYTPKRFAALAAEAGYEMNHRWTDDDSLFCVALLDCVR